VSLAPPSTEPYVERDGHATSQRAALFGLDVETSLPLVGFRQSASSSPDVVVRPRVADELREVWPAGSGELLLARTFADGRRWFTIEHAQGIGYRIWARRHGTHVVSEDGGQVESAVPGWGGWRWQRLLFAQVLPLAAQLQGFELLHASAIKLDGAVVAFVASSGTGKSTLAANLAARGAPLVTDDVLAVASSAGVVLAHPGAALVGITEVEYQRLPAAGRAALGSRIGRADKLYYSAEMATGPGPLAAICFLERGDAELELSLAEQRPPEPRRLLGAAFLSHLQTPDRLLGHLVSCAEIAKATRVLTLRMPARMSPVELAERVEERLRTVLAEA
jgi:hypothetical protein